LYVSVLQELREEGRAMELAPTTERELRAQRRRSSEPGNVTPRRKKQRTASRLVVETDNGGHLELVTDDVRMASGDTPHAARVTADTRFAADDGGAGGRDDPEEHKQEEREDAAEQRARSEDEILDLSDEVEDGGGRGRQTSPAPRTAPQPPPVPRMPSPVPRATAPQPAPVTEIIREYRGPKKMRLPVFKGLDGTMPISTWLRTVQTEARRQERTLDLRWSCDEIYFEMDSHLEGEALRWYGNAISSLAEETDESLARLLRARNGEQRSDPEVVGSLKDRKQMRGEPLVDYAVVLRAIVADRSTGEAWLIDAFLNGMDNQDSATPVRGREPTTLDEAVRFAIRQVGKFGEGHRVGLEEAMARQDARRTSDPPAPLGTLAPLGSPEQKQSPGAVGPANGRLMGFGQLPPQKPPDTTPKEDWSARWGQWLLEELECFYRRRMRASLCRRHSQGTWYRSATP
jgi:hypothetical protein